MACHLVGDKPLSETMIEYCQLNIFQWNIFWNSKVSIQENAFENVVWEMAAILSRPQSYEPTMHCSFPEFIADKPDFLFYRNLFDFIFS